MNREQKLILKGTSANKWRTLRKELDAIASRANTECGYCKIFHLDCFKCDMYKENVCNTGNNALTERFGNALYDAIDRATEIIQAIDRDYVKTKEVIKNERKLSSICASNRRRMRRRTRKGV